LGEAPEVTLERNVMWIILVHASEAFIMIRDHPKVRGRPSTATKDYRWRNIDV